MHRQEDDEEADEEDDDYKDSEMCRAELVLDYAEFCGLFFKAQPRKHFRFVFFWRWDELPGSSRTTAYCFQRMGEGSRPMESKLGES